MKRYSLINPPPCTKHIINDAKNAGWSKSQTIVAIVQMVDACNKNAEDNYSTHDSTQYNSAVIWHAYTRNPVIFQCLHLQQPYPNYERTSHER